MISLKRDFLKIIVKKENTPMTENSVPLPEYVPPKITTYTSEQILEKIGPAQTCSPTVCPPTG